jgi:8-oxo-dGTP diphosphatase
MNQVVKGAAMNTPTEDQHHELDKVRPSVGVGAMVIRDGQILLGRRIGFHGAGTYGWPGGGLEFGESLEEAAAREVRQESGLTVAGVELICVSNIREYDRHYIDFEFLVEATGEPKVLEPDRCESWEWFSLDSLPSPLFRPVEIGLSSYRTGRLYNP